MKRFVLFFIVTVTVVASLSACGQASDKVYMGGSSYIYDNILYFTEHAHLKYTRLDTGETAFLCHDPLCKHDTEDCIAYLPDGFFNHLVVDETASKMAVPAYVDCRHSMNPIKDFPGSLCLGAIAAEWCVTYPGIVMPWIYIHDPSTDTGLYFGYHDTTMRLCNWHMYMYLDVTGIPSRSMFTGEEACGEPVGIVFSHVRYPFLKKSETFSSGEFIIRVHDGDWHAGSKYYREWFLKHFPFDKKNSWLRKKSVWFSSIIYQPEDKMIADYETYNTWCQDAEKYGIDCHEIIGCDKVGLEWDYPEYVPEEKLGGKEGFRSLLQAIRSRNSKSLVFVNYNILDSCTEWYKNEFHRYAHQDPFGNTPNWMCWGKVHCLQDVFYRQTSSCGIRYSGNGTDS